jgi:hypothetical protein
VVIAGAKASMGNMLRNPSVAISAAKQAPANNSVVRSVDSLAVLFNIPCCAL